MQNLKRKLPFSFVCFLLVVVVCFSFSGCAVFENDIYYRVKKYEDADTVISTFKDNVDKFEEIVTILDNQPLNNYIFDKYMSGELGSYSIDNSTLNIIEDTDYLTEEESTAVIDFFKKYAPYTIRKGSTEGDWFDLTFIAKDRNVSLYYIGTEDSSVCKRVLSYIEQYHDVSLIRDKWYYGFGEPHDNRK